MFVFKDYLHRPEFRVVNNFQSLVQSAIPYLYFGLIFYRFLFYKIYYNIYILYLKNLFLLTISSLESSQLSAQIIIHLLSKSFIF